MKILVLHSRYLSGGASGENRVVDDETRLLTDAGHEVVSWTPATDATRSSAGLAADAIWSRSAEREVRALVRSERPDLVHVHSLYPRLSPAVVRAVPPGAPVVLTLHNFRLMCLPATYLRDGAICESCAGRPPWRGVVHACYRGSRGASAALATSLVLHRALGTFDRVSRYLAVSAFVLEKHVEAGLERHRIRVKSNFAWPTERRAGAGGPIVFVGRMTPEKGLETVVRALPRNMKLLVVGEGPERPRLERIGDGRVSFLGQLAAADVPQVMRTARALVVPSRWYEGQPRAIVEAFAAGVPVLASRIGGLPELIDDGVNGWLVAPDDASAWGSALERVSHDVESERLGEGAFETWARRFTPEVALRELEEVYREVLDDLSVRAVV